MVKPSDELSLDFLFEATAGQTYSFKLLGELHGAIQADSGCKITLPMPAATMNKLLAYESNWAAYPGSTGLSGSQPVPQVALLLQTVAGPVLDALTSAMTGTTGALSLPDGSVLEYDPSGKMVSLNPSGNAASWFSPATPAGPAQSLVYDFQSISGFTYTSADAAVGGSSGATCDYLSNIPQEAIQSFTTTPVDTLPLSQVMGDLAAYPVAGTTLADFDAAGLSGSTGVTGSALAAALESLFEQAVAAGMVTVEEGKVPSSPNLAQIASWPTTGAVPNAIQSMSHTSAGQPDAGVFGAQWTPGQSLDLYVKYKFQKVRQYQLEALSGLTGNGIIGAGGNLASTPTQAATIAFGGETFDVILGDAKEVGVALPLIYQITLLAV